MGRILITGTRSWDDKDFIYKVLAGEFLLDPDAVLVSGGQRSRRTNLKTKKAEFYGADYLCEKIWSAFGGSIERHPANWARFGNGAGFRRNEYMVMLGADKCIGFILNNSPGATFTANLAEEKGIPTIRYNITKKRLPKKKVSRKKAVKKSVRAGRKPKV